MIYLTGTTMHSLPDMFGFMVTPKKGITTLSEDPTGKRLWACDNGGFSGKFKEEEFFYFLKRMSVLKDRCLFVACPDELCNPVRTLELYEMYSGRIRELSYPVAFIAQDGQENLEFPKEFDWLFIGGSTEWKLGQGAIDCILRAKALGKRIHIGRVNSYRRWKHFALYGVDSVDGNKLKYGPDENSKIIERFYHKLEKKGLI